MGQYQDYTQKYRHTIVLYIDPLSDLRPDLEESGCRDFEYEQ